jgi:beta-lactamase superfamily II metal-dependent hydrolase
MMADRHVSIRMYNVGFGDCFLITIPTDAGDRRILFDCGSMAKGKKPIADIVDQLIADLEAVSPDGKPVLDVVICTHRHRDHISGFAKPAWNGVDVKEVWMPWTENPDDDEATAIREAQMKLAAALSFDVANRLNNPALGAAQKAELAAYEEMVANASSNEPAMDMLHEGFKHPHSIARRYLPERNQNQELVTRFTTETLPGVVIHVLGPSRDEEVIRDIDPPAGKSYMQLAAAFGPDLDDGDVAPEPFSAGWLMEKPPPPLSETDRRKIRGFSLDFASPVAAALDAAINGTSLMLLLQVGDVYMLFPGDAQWGTWNAVLRNPKWKQLLRRVRFYKIGHHGSHNATPIEFVEETIDQTMNVIAMASTRTFGSWHVPLPKLLDELALRQVTIARSDKPEEAAQPAFSVADDVIETRIPLG